LTGNFLQLRRLAEWRRVLAMTARMVRAATGARARDIADA